MIPIALYKELSALLLRLESLTGEEALAKQINWDICTQEVCRRTSPSRNKKLMISKKKKKKRYHKSLSKL